MIDTDCQLPSPAADTWPATLTALSSPRHVALMTSEQRACERLVQNLAELRKAATILAGTAIIAEITAEPAAVTW